MLQFSSRVGALTACVVFFAVSTTPLAAQNAQVKTDVLRSEADGRPIHITYFPAVSSSGGTENAAAVILLHGKNGDRLVWEQKGAGKTGKSFAAVLQDEGYAVVSVDLRKHGESKTEQDQEGMLKPNDYRDMLGDLEAVKQFLFNEHQAKKLNMNKTAIVAADDMAPVAAAYALVDWQKKPHDDAPVTSPQARTPRGRDIRALVLLSPSQTAGSLNSLAPLKFLRDPRVAMAMLIIYGTQDPEDGGTSKQIERLMAANPKNRDRVELKEIPQKFRGTDLTGKDPILVEVPILQFLDKHLKQLDSEWRDRRSRLAR